MAEPWTHGASQGPEFKMNAALVDGEIVGFVGSGPVRNEDAPAFRKLYFIYLLDAWHSTGIGPKLFDTAVEKDDPLYLWATEDNPRAHRFCTRNDFRRSAPSRRGRARSTDRRAPLR